jgi:saccharopine dehydrogenase-like NADP-dependent oxidoreductase
LTVRIAVLGAAGAMAAVVVRDLLEFAPDVSVTVADRRPLPEPGDPRVRTAAVDVRDEEATARLLDGHDAVANCVTYYFNVPVMRAALRARVPYTDLGGLYHGTLKQFALDAEFRQAGVAALLGMGSTPGITNVMAGALARRFDAGAGGVEAIHVRVGCIDRTASGPLPVPYALDTVIDEFSLEPMVFRGGRAEAVPPGSGEETIRFPDPVGEARAFYTLHSEVAMFPRSFPGLSEASFKVAFEPEFTRKMRFLVDLGFASREKRAGDASPREMLLALAAAQPAPAVSPGEADPDDCDALRVDVSGRKAGRAAEARAEMVVLPRREWRIAAGSLDTGVPLSIAAQMLADGTVSEAGVLCPETAVPPEKFFGELARRGMEVRFHP